METKVKLKEGYFKTKEYLLIIKDNELTLTSNENKSYSKTFTSDDLVSITITKHANPKIELKMKNEQLSVLLLDSSNLCKLQTALLDFKSKITFEG
ncbi:MAG: hypothetical protein ACLFPS_07505 [Clostridia bacterium]